MSLPLRCAAIPGLNTHGAVIAMLIVLLMIILNTGGCLASSTPLSGAQYPYLFLGSPPGAAVWHTKTLAASLASSKVTLHHCYDRAPYAPLL